MTTTPGPPPYLERRARSVMLWLARGLAAAAGVASVTTIAVPLGFASTFWFTALIASGILAAGALNALVWWSWHPTVIVMRSDLIRRVGVLSLVSPAVAVAWSIVVVVIYSVMQQVVRSFLV